MAEKQKLSGMEHMMQSLMRAAGFKPEEISKATILVVNQMQGGLQLVTDRLKTIMDEQAIAKMERRAIMEHLGISIPGEIIPPEQISQQANGKDHTNA